MFAYKNHVGTDRTHGFIRRSTVTHAAAHDGDQLGALLDPDNTASGVWADTAYRSAANLDLLDRRGLKPEFQRAKPRRRPMPRHVARGRRARVPAKVEHVFAAQKHRLVIRTVGLARATAKLALANLAYETATPTPTDAPTPLSLPTPRPKPAAMNGKTPCAYVP